MINPLFEDFVKTDEYPNGSGFGYGFGDGYGIEFFNGEKVCVIDNTPTILRSVHGNSAKGFILQSNLTLTPCFVYKMGNFFAHGETLREAYADALEKYQEKRPLSERIGEFNRKYPDREKKVPARELFSWHHILTGSCLFGRQNFCEEHGIDYKNGEYSVNEFIKLTLNAYGGDSIRQLRDTLPSK